MKWWFRQKLHVQVLIGAALGIVVGILLQDHAAYLDPIGQIFLRLLKFLVVPLVIATLLSGVLQMTSVKELGSVGARFFVYLTGTSILASAAGVGMALLIRPGIGLNLNEIQKEDVAPENYDVTEQLLGWVPDNFFTAMADMDMIPIIIGTVLFAVAMLFIGEERLPRAYALVREGTEIMLRLTNMIIWTSPYGVFALLAVLVGTTGTEMLGAAAKFIIADFAGIILVAVVVYPTILFITARLNPVTFYRNAWPSTVFAMTTSSSAATIPVSMKVAQDNMGVPRKIFGFTIPFGATANMDGFAVALGVISIFAADAFGIEITAGLVVQIVLLGLALSIGAAGVRGAGIVMSAVLFQALGMPLDLIPLLAAIWPLIDVGHTGLNITGDLTGTATVAAQTKNMDRKVFSQRSKSLTMASD
ncbi:dicarboxylate/amino acid:cation symporter [Brevibacterium sediminis]|uniref:dicarboxylate/amino acid:cation symporter n=1 Tax=Brevibacterium sediminis TaxID=1857024 RepID=UPI0021753206|nr:dicarboxylate/amino acid:cation symporter [Brevibacterium sediminis]MCS4593313.1 dicarboxylate/amino acid:cation symporter [Brevibacterium sediminis]